MSTPYILVVDDEPEIRHLVQEILEDEGYEVSVAENAEQARRARRLRRPDLVLLDIWMPDVDGISLLKEWSDENGLDMPVIIMSGHATVETAVEATRLGAYDFIEKPLSLAKLLLTVENTLHTDKLQKENIDLRRYSHHRVEPVGKSPLMHQLREHVARFARHENGVLLTGEPGSGKRLFARYLHELSSRREAPFIEISMASFAEEDANEELFGSERNDQVRFGRLEQANGGTLFLRDVAEMDASIQARLYSALQNRRFHRVNGLDAVKTDVRVIAATHHDLESLVNNGSFRQDLYYKLNELPLYIPPLREHCEDIPELLAFYADFFATSENLSYRSFTVAAQNHLRNYPWPGNVRELTNLVQRLLIVGNGDEIDREEVESVLGAGPVKHASMSAYQPEFDLPLREARERFERAYLEHQLRKMGGNVGKVARIAGIERTHLYRKLRTLGIDHKELAGKSTEQ
ncbi:MAG TPA: sigma-54-dependent Fis family transcriptional regulator [Gammaproteobacteria bacterium]|nr:sigma-54-dependent Fis family transcriptional regulator [Gammaproteobacteria bacterium]